MKLHTVFITYNRLELTKIAVESYLETVTLPYTYVVVDNASTDDTREWLAEEEHPVLLADENRFTGWAANAGWAMMPEDTTHLHRAENDWKFLPGWCDEVKRMFRNRKLGQLGLRTDEQDAWNSNNVAGDCIITRKLWDAGLRYDERTWAEICKEKGRGWSEDGIFSPAVRKQGYRWDRVERPCIESLASGSWSDPYYQRSYGLRGIRPRRNDPTVPADWTGGYST